AKSEERFSSSRTFYLVRGEGLTKNLELPPYPRGVRVELSGLGLVPHRIHIVLFGEVAVPKRVEQATNALRRFALGAGQLNGFLGKANRLTPRAFGTGTTA